MNQPPLHCPEAISVQRPERTVMANGVPLSVLNVGESEVTRIDLLFEAGRFRQAAPLQALFTNRMLREGTQSLSGAELAERLDYYGAWLDLSVTAEHAHVTLYSLNRYLPETLPLLESIVKEPTFPQEELQTVVEANYRQFLINCSRVDFLALRALREALFGPTHPCGKMATGEDYQRLTAEGLRQFYTRYYHSRNLSVGLSGRITPACLDRVERTLGSAPFGEGFLAPERRTFWIHPDDLRRTYVRRDDAMQSAVRMGLLSIDRRHPDYLALRVLVTLLGGYFGSRLMQNIREEKGFTYHIQADLTPYPGGSTIIIGSETTNEFVNPLICEVYHEMRRLQEEPVGEAELTMVKNYLIGDLCRNCESAFSLADVWTYIQLSGLSETYFADYVRTIREMTPERIRQLAQTYLRLNDIKEAVAGRDA